MEADARPISEYLRLCPKCGYTLERVNHRQCPECGCAAALENQFLCEAFARKCAAGVVTFGVMVMASGVLIWAVTNWVAWPIPIFAGAWSAAIIGRRRKVRRTAQIIARRKPGRMRDMLHGAWIFPVLASPVLLFLLLVFLAQLSRAGMPR